MPYWKKNGQVTIEQEFAAAEKKTTGLFWGVAIVSTVN